MKRSDAFSGVNSSPWGPPQGGVLADPSYWASFNQSSQSPLPTPSMNAPYPDSSDEEAMSQDYYSEPGSFDEFCDPIDDLCVESE